MTIHGCVVLEKIACTYKKKKKKKKLYFINSYICYRYLQLNTTFITYTRH